MTKSSLPSRPSPGAMWLVASSNGNCYSPPLSVQPESTGQLRQSLANIVPEGVVPTTFLFPKFGLFIWEGLSNYIGLPVDAVLIFKDSKEFSGKQRTQETLSTHAEYMYSFFPRTIPVNSYVWNTLPACAAVQAPYLGIIQAGARFSFTLGWDYLLLSITIRSSITLQ